MTSEHKFTLWVTALAALPTILFTGAVAYWTWKRDQERIIVQKSPLCWNMVDDTQGPVVGVGVVVTNLSLFPARILSLGFRLDKKTALVLMRDEHDRGEWPLELASHSRMIVYAKDPDWKILEVSGASKRIMDRRFIAVARTETGNMFSSNRLSVGIMRPLRSIRRLFSRTGAG